MTLAVAPSVLDPSLYIPDLKPKKKEAVLAEMVGLAHHSGVVRAPALLVELLMWRERLGSTALGKGVALPHARSVTITRPQLVVARSRRGIEWSAPDDLAATLVILALAPAEWSEETFHELLGRAAAIARLQRNRQKLMAAESFDAVALVLREVMS